ncbi:MAG: hypothetical protein KGY74_07175 [Candidatus Cloacimonetes bacterium]|nr:hypothetical protein [Candidatus Cloacimonadota bacterium]
MGKGLANFIISFTRQAVLLIPIMHTLGQLFEPNYIWLVFPLGEATTCLIVVI